MRATPSPVTFDLQGLERACRSIAPTWPLDRFIAVNPFWEQIERPMEEVGAQLLSRAGTSLLMPRAWFREAFHKGAFTEAHLREVLQAEHDPRDARQLLGLLDEPEPTPSPRLRALELHPGLRTLALDHLSQWCASFFDEAQATLPGARPHGLWRGWRERVVSEIRRSSLEGSGALAEALGAVPAGVMDTLRLTLEGLEVPLEHHESYAASLLLSLNGWAAWCAYRQWQRRLAGEPRDEMLLELLAIHLAWDWAALRAGGPARLEAWRLELARWPARDARAATARRDDWWFQRALELAWHQDFKRRLALRPGSRADPAPAAHLVFCIDVRSEVLRRAFERSSAEVHTSGFAGFFGVPAAYQPDLVGSARPQLPGLLAPRLRMDDGSAERRRRHAAGATGQRAVERGPLTALSFVENLGLARVIDLVADSLPGRAPASLDDPAPAPRLTASDGSELTTGALVEVAAGILQNLGLTRFAPLEVFVGHGSSTRNNPHAAAYDCGACCGQTGALNARTAAWLLNRPDVRAGLRARGREVPAETFFLAALHDTTTENVVFFDTAQVPPALRPALQALQSTAQRASHLARLERAPRIGLTASVDPAVLREAFEHRAWDWAQPRPEWGLAGNAAFVIAPRALTHGVDLGGRCFLHDYDAQLDPDFSVLETLLTAPMIVTHWINLQYYASTVAPERFGSGNKLLHDVVGQHLGVFEGAGGDLRIGLSRQAVHDGVDWVHVPLRLAVYVQAPRAALEGLLERHERVRQLVEHGWLSLHHLDAQGHTARRTAAGWQPS